MSDVTRILEAIQHGDARPADELLPLVYEELRKLAAHKMANEMPGQTLQPTALVHEAYLQLVGSGMDEKWQGRAHFLATAAVAMRHILIDNARKKARDSPMRRSIRKPSKRTTTRWRRIRGFPAST